LGTVWITQREPFQRSANGPALSDPTAVQAFAAVHDTERSVALLSVAGVWIDHVAPFHRSISTEVPAQPPTAVQTVADEQDTPLRRLLAKPTGRGTDCMDQLEPFQRSASGYTYADPGWAPATV
jgi:hypothetical protein